MRVRTLAILLMLSSLSGFSISMAHAAKWQTIASQDGKRIEIDKARIARVGEGQTMAWTRLLLDRELMVDEQRYNRVEVLNRYDCSGQRFATVKRIYLQGINPVKEEVINSGAQHPISASAGSVDARLLGEACKLRTVGEMQAVAERAREAASAAAPVEEAATAKVMLADVRQLAATPEEAKAKAAHTQTVADQRIGLPSKAELAAKAEADKALLTETAAPPATTAPAKTGGAASTATTAPAAAPAAAPVIPSAASLRRPAGARAIPHRPSRPALAPTAPIEASAPAARPSIPWSYEGEGGPANWGKLRSDYATCDSGKRQSPIDIRDSINVDLEQIKFDYKPTRFRIVDTGHTVEVHVGEGSTLTVMGRQYELVQLHFHRPSEERINGKIYDMSVHLVHRSLDGQLAYLAVLLEKGGEQPLIQTLWNNMPLEVGQELTPEDAIDLNNLLPENRTYWTYMGSLTTPPCTENVLWLVMKQPLQISAEQVAIFSRVYRGNVRPLQPTNNRLIKGSR